MSFYYKLYDSLEWSEINHLLNETNLHTLNDIKLLINNLGKLPDDIEFKTLDSLKNFYDEKEIINIFNNIKKYALNLPRLFSSGNIPKLNNQNQLVELKRFEVLCLLSHMILCTLKKSTKNFYWVTFENWLTDGRCCAIEYLHTLLEYFRQTFQIDNLENNEFMNEFLVFKRKSIDKTQIDSILESNDSNICNLQLELNGFIGDEPYPEVDFANRDIGYGITGTQEEMLFGSSPELCVAMLFCDTLNDNESVSITGARKVAKFDGYGLNISINSFLPQDYRKWNERTIIAIDALDFSDEMQDFFKKQLTSDSLCRELIKSYAGFSLVENTKISTGHWGCGAFRGNKQLKALIQLIAASLTKNNLIFYCHADVLFYEKFNRLLNEIYNKRLKVSNLWKMIMNIQNDLTNVKDENICEYLIKKISECK
jgi:poly(ADP-ribose) glycohydrolase